MRQTLREKTAVFPSDRDPAYAGSISHRLKIMAPKAGRRKFRRHFISPARLASPEFEVAEWRLSRPHFANAGVPVPPGGRTDLLAALNTFLLDCAKQGCTAALVIDDLSTGSIENIAGICNEQE
jgi:hypothetical protein